MSALDPEYRKLPAKPLKRPPANEPATLVKAVVSAIQALERGEANMHQQKMALEFIINEMSGPYNPDIFDPSNPRLTDFGLGRAFVGQQIIGALKVNLAYFVQKENKR